MAVLSLSAVAADGRGGWYWSLDLGDPAQSTLQRDVTLRDRRVYLSGAMWTRPLLGAVRFGLEYQHVWRTSYMLSTIITSTESDFLATTALTF